MYNIFFKYILGGPTHTTTYTDNTRKKLSGLVPRHSETVTQTVAAEGIRTEHGHGRRRCERQRRRPHRLPCRRRSSSYSSPHSPIAV